MTTLDLRSPAGASPIDGGDQALASPAGLVVAALPALGVEPGHIAEAARALRAQGRPAPEAAVVELLWIARALPAALDVLADGRLDAAQAEAGLVAAEVELAAGGGIDPSPLVAVAHLDLPDEPGAEAAARPPLIVVQLVDRRAFLAAGSDAVPPRCTVRFSLAPAPQAAGPEDVPVRRFTVGRP
jgi:hypothetical protein